MSLESTETSPEPLNPADYDGTGLVLPPDYSHEFEPMPVPADYGGILDANVVSDENNNVTELPAENVEPEDTPATEGIAISDPSWRRYEALSHLVKLLPYTPEELRATSIEGYLAEADKIAVWLNGPETATP